jgi:L-ascorbate metabolism protein UlaG (beta-lactamase superfamily)
MLIRHYLYNAFLIESGDLRLAIDPGGKFLHYLSLKTLIPKGEWADITHIFVTHGDPDHYWHIDRVARTSGAKVILNRSMVKEDGGKTLALSPRRRGLTFKMSLDNLHTISVDQTLELDGMIITGLKATHGPLKLKIGPFSKTVTPGAEERVGWGSIGFRIGLRGQTAVNLGDTLLHLEEWSALDQPDVLMIPIGGKTIGNTMNEQEALRAVSMIRPRVVIPMHYNCPAFFTNRYNPADDQAFKQGAEKLGCECCILRRGDQVNIV